MKVIKGKPQQKQTFTDEDFLCECCGQPVDKILRARKERKQEKKIGGITKEIFEEHFKD